MNIQGLTHYFCHNELCPNHVLVDINIILSGVMYIYNKNNTKKMIRNYEYLDSTGSVPKIILFCISCHNAIQMFSKIKNY